MITRTQRPCQKRGGMGVRMYRLLHCRVDPCRDGGIVIGGRRIVEFFYRAFVAPVRRHLAIGQRAGEHLVDDHAQGIDVRTVRARLVQ